MHLPIGHLTSTGIGAGAQYRAADPRCRAAFS
jgi:hypothetical protein